MTTNCRVPRSLSDADMRRPLIRSPSQSRSVESRLNRRETWTHASPRSGARRSSSVEAQQRPQFKSDAVWGASQARIARFGKLTDEPPEDVEVLPVPEETAGIKEVLHEGETHAPRGNLLSSIAACVPGVLIGTTMNMMLSVPFGLAFFPASWEPFPVPLAIGLQMFLFSTFLCQVIMTFSSEFPCAMGMMMVENIPFMHTLAQQITNEQGFGPDAMATTMTAFALSTLIMGVCFYVLGKYKLGKAVNYFPRHFIIGCIGGIGIFVTTTGFEVSTGRPWQWCWHAVQTYTDETVYPLWVVVVALVIILNILIRVIDFPLLPPLYFVGIIPCFYVVLMACGVDADVARAGQWIFDHPPKTDCWLMWELFQISSVRWDLIFNTIPTLVALTCFGLMHAPINVPSLSTSTKLDVDMNHELKVHGWTNILCGLVGGLPNYLCYSNSLLYWKCQGGGRGSGFALSAILAGAFVVGPDVIAYVPRCMAGCLLVHVGLDLSKEALVDSIEAFDTFEYVSIVLITITMTALGMTSGLALGILLSAISFTLQNISHSEPVRGVMSAATLQSTAMRNRAERDVLDRDLQHVQVMQLQGTLFFGNATGLSSCCDEMLAAASGGIHTIVLDFTLVRSLESSAAEAIAKIFNITRKHGSELVINRGSTEGFPTSAPLSMRLQKLCDGTIHGPRLHITDDLDDALVWIEDTLLDQARERGELPLKSLESGESSSRQGSPFEQLHGLCPYEEKDIVERLLAKMERRIWQAGAIIWKQGDSSDFCFLLHEGLLVNSLENEAGTAEECHPGCLVGEYHLLNQEKRMGTLVAKEDSVGFILSSTELAHMQKSEPYLAYVLASICIRYLGQRCHHVSNRIWHTRCLPI